MKRYMVISQRKADISLAHIQHLAVAEQTRSDELRREGTLIEIYVTQDYQRAFLLFSVESEEQLQTILQSYPLYPYADWEIAPLHGDGG